MYYKIYHHTSTLLYTALLCKMNNNVFCQRCWHDFVIKDVTVKQVSEYNRYGQN